MGLFNNKENESHSFEQIIEKLKVDYANLEKDNIAKEEEIRNLKSTIESLKGGSTSNEKEVVVESIVENEQTTPDTNNQNVIDYTPALNAINATLNELKEQSNEMKVQLSRRDIQDENVRAMHKEMERYKADFFAKITQPYLVALLDLHKRFYEAYAYFDRLDNNEETDFAKLYQELMGQFDSAVKAIENRIYNDFGVEYYEPQENDEFNPKAHQAFEVIETPDAALHRKVAKTVYGGFRDIDSDKIIRPARIVCYKNSQNQE